MIQWLDSIFADGVPNRCLFRVDAGPIWGLSFGHLVRCRILSKILRNKFGCDCLFLMRDIIEGKEFALNAGEKVKTISGRQNFLVDDRCLLKTVQEYMPDWVFIDLPYDDMQMASLLYMTERGVKTFYLDDWRFENPGTDIYHNSNVLASYINIRNRIPNTKYLLGLNYLIIDQSLIDNNVRPARDRFTVTLSFGGSDPTQLTQKVLETIINYPFKGLQLMVVIGPGNKDRNEIHLLSKEHKWVNLYENPENIYNLFQKSNLVICSGGRTMYELHYLKRRFFPIGSIEHEARAINEFVRRRIIEDGMTGWDSHQFLAVFQKVLSDTNLELSNAKDTIYGV